jgi:RNA polymerase sigma-70 factor, ECF subfamily
MPAYAASRPVGVVDVGLDALRDAVLAVLRGPASWSPSPGPSSGLESPEAYERRFDVLVSQAHGAAGPVGGAGGSAAGSVGGAVGGAAGGAASGPAGDRPSDPDRDRVVLLVRRAQAGDTEAFGQLYDRYVEGIYRFCYHRVSSVSLAEDLTSETFYRALRGIAGFRWQGRDFGAWLTTIARNLVTDHYKSSRARLETVSDELPERDDKGPGPEEAALTLLTNEALGQALHRLPAEQRDCLVMRFLQGLSIAETAEVLGRSDGAVKQLQLRAVRNLAKWLPRGVR